MVLEAFNESEYTVPIDTTAADYEEQQRRAEILAKEIRRGRFSRFHDNALEKNESWAGSSDVGPVEPWWFDLRAPPFRPEPDSLRNLSTEDRAMFRAVSPFFCRSIRRVMAEEGLADRPSSGPDSEASAEAQGLDST
mmetsp:Transcript_83821/g.224183  ORF Transcript_83821/g.224183 Transcript_83821/m.224183 type:complete len:137 (-) Transcript_83821:124-534(-)